jgi:hypothetical protein
MKQSIRILVSLLVLSAPAFASQGLRHLSVPLGGTKSIQLSEKVSSVKVDDPAVLEAREQDGKVLLSPLSTGKSKIQIRTRQNTEVDLLVFVTSGSDVELIERR